MSYSISNKFVDTTLFSIHTPSLSKLYRFVMKKVRRRLIARFHEDREFENMANSMGLRLSINQRSWKRNSALIVYSKYQAEK